MRIEMAVHVMNWCVNKKKWRECQLLCGQNSGELGRRT